MWIDFILGFCNREIKEGINRLSLKKVCSVSIGSKHIVWTGVAKTHKTETRTVGIYVQTEHEDNSSKEEGNDENPTIILQARKQIRQLPPW